MRLFYIAGVGIPNNPNKDYRENLSKKIADEITDEAYGNRAKVGQEGIFTRDKILTISRLVIMIMKFKSSVQREPDSFFKEISNEDFNIRAVAKGAFTKARAKLDPWAFKRLNQVAADAFYEKAPFYAWRQKRLLAVDGTKLMLPNHPTVTEEFGQLSGKTALAVKQDFHAKIFLLTLMAAYAHPVEQKVREEFKADENRKHGQKINRTHAIATTQHILIAVMLKRVAKKALEAFDLIVSKTREIIRPERSNPRKKRPRRHYNMNYKPL